MGRLRKPSHFWCKVYKVNYFFCIGWSGVDLSEYMLKKWDHRYNPSGKDGACFHCEDDHGDSIIIWTRKKTDYPCMAHECCHAVNMVFDKKGLKFGLDNDECQTYMVECLMREAISGTG